MIIKLWAKYFMKIKDCLVVIYDGLKYLVI